MERDHGIGRKLPGSSGGAGGGGGVEMGGELAASSSAWGRAFVSCRWVAFEQSTLSVGTFCAACSSSAENFRYAHTSSSVTFLLSRLCRNERLIHVCYAVVISPCYFRTSPSSGMLLRDSFPAKDEPAISWLHGAAQDSFSSSLVGVLWINSPV